MTTWNNAILDPPENDVNVLAFIPGLGQRVCYINDLEWHYAVNERWGINVTSWQPLEPNPIP